MYIIRDREEEIEIDDMDGMDTRREGEKNDRNNLPYTRVCCGRSEEKKYLKFPRVLGSVTPDIVLYTYIYTHILRVYYTSI